MPTIFFYGPELEKEKKRELIRAFTAAASQATGIPQSAFVVYLRKSGEEDVGVGESCWRTAKNNKLSAAQAEQAARGCPKWQLIFSNFSNTQITGNLLRAGA